MQKRLRYDLEWHACLPNNCIERVRAHRSLIIPVFLENEILSAKLTNEKITENLQFSFFIQHL